jgi:hypothetical protein
MEAEQMSESDVGAQFPQELLDAAETAVKGQPGITSGEVSHAVPTEMLRRGRPAVTMSRDKAKALLQALEREGKVTRRTAQARVGFYPAQEDIGAE